MTVLPTERAPIEAPAPTPADTQAAPEASAHPRLDRRRQRRRHRIEATLVILALPVAVALTLFMLLTASGGSVLPAEETVAETVRVEGALPIIAADRLVGDGLVLDVTTGATDRDRTEVLYFSSGDRERAEELAEAIGADVVVLGTSKPAGATFVIRVGEDLAL